MARPNRLRDLAKSADMPLEELVLKTLNEEQTITAAAQKMGISMHTLFRWVEERHFRKETRWFLADERSNCNARGN